MCVIAICHQIRPTEEQIENMFAQNPHGAGIAFREPFEDKEGKESVRVHWRKGLNLEEIKAEIAKAPFPFVAHFRVPSCGGSAPELCHPFPIDKNVPLFTDGVFAGNVLFHNGHWTAWKENLLRTAQGHRIKIAPNQKWSDTRAMAFLAYYVGQGALQLIDEKYVVFGPDTLDVGWPTATAWSKVEQENSYFWVSNTDWKYRASRGSGVHYPFRGRNGREDAQTEGDRVLGSHNRGKERESSSADPHATFRGSADPVSEGKAGKAKDEGSQGPVQQIPAEGGHAGNQHPHETHAELPLSAAKRAVIHGVDPDDLHRWIRGLNPNPFRRSDVVH